MKKIFSPTIYWLFLWGDTLIKPGGMFYPDSREIIEKIAQDSGAYFINIDSIEENIQYRMQLYKKTAADRPIKFL